jgi:hypothetical protein
MCVLRVSCFRELLACGKLSLTMRRRWCVLSLAAAVSKELQLDKR